MIRCPFSIMFILRTERIRNGVPGVYVQHGLTAPKPPPLGTREKLIAPHLYNTEKSMATPP